MEDLRNGIYRYIFWGLVCLWVFFPATAGKLPATEGTLPARTGTLRPMEEKLPSTEVRAVWLTTNYGLDWPHSRDGVAAQKRELVEILDRLVEYNFNTVFFQVRGRGEVLYCSAVEPMSSLVASSGVGGALFDPLAFAVEECHKRGLACHAWVVTYPLGNDKHVKSLGSRSVAKRQPALVKKFKGEWFLDPGNPKTDDYLLSVVKEIVSGYDVDGIHFDYIRYPDNRGRFPDEGLFRLYGKGKTRDEWRRDNITRFVVKAYDLVKGLKPWVQVSSAPLGRYRSLGGAGNGWTAFETVSQDAGKWMMTGKHDALYPMMYYKEGLFYPFVDDWLKYSNGRIVAPGLGAYQMIELGWSRRDILDQVDYTRKSGTRGQAFFRAGNVLADTKGILGELKEYYRFPAKLPPMPWLCDTVPRAPGDLRAERDDKGGVQLSWMENPGERISYNVYRCETDSLDREDGRNLMATGLREPVFSYPAVDDDRAYYYFVTASDAFHNESEPCAPAFFYHSKTVK